jgi:hypothetical protein
MNSDFYHPLPYPLSISTTYPWPLYHPSITLLPPLYLLYHHFAPLSPLPPFYLSFPLPIYLYHLSLAPVHDPQVDPKSYIGQPIAWDIDDEEDSELYQFMEWGDFLPDDYPDPQAVEEMRVVVTDAEVTMPLQEPSRGWR